MALSYDDIRESDGRTASYPIANSQVIAVDDLVALDIATGYARRLADTSGFEPIGRCIGFSDLDTANGTDTGDTSASPVPEVIVMIGREVLRGISVTGVSGQLDVGDPVYASDHDSLNNNAPTTNIPAIGIIDRYHSGTTVDVRRYSMEDMRSE